MFKRFQFLLATIICVTNVSIHAVAFYNESSKRVEFKDIVFCIGEEGLQHPCQLFLKPQSNESCCRPWSLFGIKALTVVFKPENTEIRFSRLTTRTYITLHADLTSTRKDVLPNCCSVQ